MPCALRPLRARMPCAQPEAAIWSPLRASFDPKSLQQPSGFVCGGACVPLARGRPCTRAPDCGMINDVKFSERVRCLQCGYRILYKRRQRQRACLLSSAPAALMLCRAWCAALRFLAR